MPVQVFRGALADILGWRALFLQELHAQCRYDACHRRGWSDIWLLQWHDRIVGYGAVKAGDRGPTRDVIFEWYVSPAWRHRQDDLFAAFVAASGAEWVECQTNDPCLYSVAHRVATDLQPTTVLFEADKDIVTEDEGAGRIRGRESAVTFTHTSEPVGDQVLEVEGEIVGTAGHLTHYNPPFADIYMEVAPAHRRKGYGARLVAGAIRECWLSGHVPAARCSIDNVASRKTLLKGGMREVGHVVLGQIRR
jgi:GNAT superfamily N-acetyltransferase